MSWKKNWRKRRNAAYQESVSRSRFFSKVAKLAFFGLIGAIFFTIFFFFWYARDLPQPDKIVRKEGFSTKIFDRNQKLLYDIYANQRRTLVDLPEIPQYL
ncbi:MAG: hypothetical protein Q8P80_02975, partial [Candidatus Levybacteria bacterium]|nr:hypothetical protein [Candidatus Levybacteria bacterium]